MQEYIVLFILIIIICCILYNKWRPIIHTITGGYKNIDEQLLYLVRHGETDINLNGQANSKALKTPINNTGKRQAKKTGEYFKRLQQYTNSEYTIYSSPSLRAKQTAKIIANVLNIDNITYDERLIEADNGDVEGLTDNDPLMVDVLNTVNEYKKSTNNDDILFQYDVNILDDTLHKKYHIEPYKHVKKRIKSFLYDLPKDKHIIIVTHSGLINAAISTIFNIRPQLKGDMNHGKNTTITAMLKLHDHFTLLTLPNTKHLDHK